MIDIVEKHAICHKYYRLQSFFKYSQYVQYVHGDLFLHLGIDTSTDRMIGIPSVLESIPKCLHKLSICNIDLKPIMSP